MKKILIIFMLLLSIFIINFLYENTKIYLYFNSNIKLQEKIKNKKFDNINFLTALNAIDEENNRNYDMFLLSILKEKENLDWTLCQKCQLTVKEYANAILNKEYPNQNIPYLVYYNRMTQLKEYDGKYSFPILESDKLKIIKLSKEENKEEIMKIIDRINDESIMKWEKIIKENS